ncbi:MAG: hypothetical protein EBT92_06685 [Planctomycetes bacterium]|nr:hypothetical protein [Planctomycetota bacterium]NBY02613.1 hypothetical protein [Planctomycetota bacterium]
MIKDSKAKRKGVGLLACLVVMALTSVLLVTVVVQEISTRKKFEQINFETKVQNLAISAREIALSFLLEDASAKIPNTIAPTSDAKVFLKVQETSNSCYTIEVDAEYTPQDKKPIRYRLSGSFLIKTKDGKRFAQSIGR